MKTQKNSVGEFVRKILKKIPSDVLLLAAAKTRTLEEVKAVIEAGVTHIGYNYIQEFLPIIESIGNQVTWHMIGHLQRNKAKIAVEHFDMIETVDSWKLAQTLEQYCESQNKSLSVLVEINSGREKNKTGVLPELVDELVEKISDLHFLQVEGVMTMGPRFGNPEESRPYFKTTRAIYEHFALLNLPNINMRYLSMGMSNSYHVAIEEGANIIRIGTKLFGER